MTRLAQTSVQKATSKESASLRGAALLCVMILLPVIAQAANLRVNCSGGKDDAFRTITAAVAHLNQAGPNTITVTGSCVENVLISSLDNLTLQASRKGASITDASGGTLDTLAVADSNRFALNGFTINGSVNCTENSVCRLQGNTIQNSQTFYGLRASRAFVDSQNDSISNNSGVGALVQNQSRVSFTDDTINNNGLHGVQVFLDGFVDLTGSASTTTISNNGLNGVLATSHGTVRLTLANITGNALDGIRVLHDSVLRTGFVAPSVNNITGNGAAGVHVGDLSHAFFANDGSMNITGNHGGTDVVCSGQFSATRNVSSVGGSTNCLETTPI